MWGKVDFIDYLIYVTDPSATDRNFLQIFSKIADWLCYPEIFRFSFVFNNVRFVTFCHTVVLLK